MSNLSSYLKFFISTDGKLFCLGVNPVNKKPKKVNILTQDFLTNFSSKKVKKSKVSLTKGVDLFTNTYI